MNQPYRIPQLDETAMAIGRKLVAVLVESNVTYSKALDALSAALDILGDETKPISASVPHQSDCTQTSYTI